MIKLTKSKEPDVLLQNASDWLDVLNNRFSRGEKPTEVEKSRYRHPDIKSRLVEETHGKCAYCESKLLHVTYGDVEHITPKSTDVSESFRWANLTLACDVCNTNKGNVIDIVDPYTDEPNDYFKFVGPMVIPRADSEKALLTDRCLKLNRAMLFERRKEKILYLNNQLVILHNTKDQKLKSIIEQDIRINETSSDQEFAAIARSFINQFLPINKKPVKWVTVINNKEKKKTLRLRYKKQER